MKRVILFAFASLSLLRVSAQGSAVTSAWNYLRYGELDKAQESIDKAVMNEETKSDPKAWLYRGQTYEMIARTQKPEYKKLSPDASKVAIESYAKAVTLDTRKKYSDMAVAGGEGKYIGMQGLAQNTANMGVEAYNKQEFASALNAFETYSMSNDAIGKYTGKSVIDTNVIYYMGFSAYSSKNNEKAKMYLSELASKYKYKEASAYQTLADIYKSEKDTAKALEVLNMGLANAKDKKNLLLTKLDIYLRRGDNTMALEEAKKAIELDPNNMSIYLVMGTMYQNMHKEKEAEQIYQQALVKDPDNFEVNNLIGVNYYNIGADLYNKSIDIKDPKKSAAVEQQAQMEWKKGIPFLEKAYTKKSTDPETKRLLKEMYVKTNQMDKATKIK